MTTEHEQPQHGGSYLRGEDGKLTRVDAGAAAAPIATEPAADTKPARTSKKEK